MHVNCYSPSAVLQPYIDNYMFVDIDWRTTSVMPALWRLIPFGQVSALFLYGDNHQYSPLSAGQQMEETSGAFLVGQLTRPLWLKFSGHTRLAKVQFRTGGVQQFLTLPLAELTDTPSTCLAEFWGPEAHLLNEQLHAAESDYARCALLNRFFQSELLSENLQANYVHYTLRQLHQTLGNCRLADLEHSLGISARQLERVFHSRVGLSPKTISKFIRINAALNVLEHNPSQQLSALGYQLGYFDPAHFSKEFKQVTGISPSVFHARDKAEYLVSGGKCFSTPACRIFTKTTVA